MKERKKRGKMGRKERLIHEKKEDGRGHVRRCPRK